MSRTSKDFKNKRNELLDKIWDIFITNGYENTTMSLIMNQLDISKGAFYHYFSSKEECADAAIERQVEQWINQLTEYNSKQMKADDRLKNLILMGAEINNTSEQNQEINAPSNAIFHQKLIIAIIKQFSPVYAEIISQGVEEKLFTVEHPLETAEIILTLANFYFDADLFKWRAETMKLKAIAFEEMLEKVLGAKKNTFSFISKLFEEEKK